MSSPAVDLRRLETDTLAFERGGRIAAAIWLGLTLIQIIGAAMVLNGANSDALSEMGVTHEALPKVLGAAAFYILMGGLLTLAVNSGSVWWLRIAMTVLSFVWFAVVATVVWAAIVVCTGAWQLSVHGVDLRAAMNPATLWYFTNLVPWMDIPAAAIPLALALTAACFLLSLDAALAIASSVRAAFRHGTRQSRTLRGLRRRGILRLEGLLAAFDLPVVLASRGKLISIIFALAAVLAGSLGLTLWLSLPFNYVIIITMLLQGGDEEIDPTRLSMMAQIITEAPNMFMAIVVIAVIFVLICLLGAFLARVSRRELRSQGKQSELGRPIVFLRSFAHDQARVRPAHRFLIDRFLDFGRSPLSMDEILVYEFASNGPVIALGKPGEKRAPFGAHRIYADHNSWREDIEALIDGAQASILVADMTPGLAWETEQSLKRPDWRKKTLFVLPDAKAFDQLKALASDLLEPAGLRPGERIVAAHASQAGWRLWSARRPTRVTYQVAARLFFSSLADEGGGP
jgi:hypothetical protein